MRIEFNEQAFGDTHREAFARDGRVQIRNFLTAHDDNVEGKNRRVAYRWNLLRVPSSHNVSAVRCRAALFDHGLVSGRRRPGDLTAAASRPSAL